MNEGAQSEWGGGERVSSVWLLTLSYTLGDAEQQHLRKEALIVFDFVMGGRASGRTASW